MFRLNGCFMQAGQLFQLAFNGIVIAIGIFTHRFQEATREVLPRWSNISREPKETHER
jgi:hypothetical protein